MALKRGVLFRLFFAREPSNSAVERRWALLLREREGRERAERWRPTFDACECSIGPHLSRDAQVSVDPHRRRG